MGEAEQMTGRTLAIRVAAAAAVFWCSAVWADSIGPFEEPSAFETSDLMPVETMTGPNFKVEEITPGDGIFHRFTFDTPYGLTTVQGRYQFQIRRHDLLAVDHMEQVSRTEAFGEAMADAAAGPFSTAADLITDPAETTGNIVSGTGKWMGNMWDAATNWGSDDDNLLEAASGFAANKRAVAAAYGIDPYTRYEPLQAQLKDIAWASFAGGFSVQMAFTLVPDTPGLILQVGAFANMMAGLVADNTPAELRRINRGKLEVLGVNPDVIDIFLASDVYSPTQQTYLVGALERMGGVANISGFVKEAALDTTEVQALYRRRQAELMAAYHNLIEPVQSIVVLNNVPFMQRADGIIVGTFSADYVDWTEEVGVFAYNVTGDAKGAPLEVWITGFLSPQSQERFEGLGWTINQDAEKFLTLP